MGQAYQPLHLKYRPQRFDQLVGQEAIAATLTAALRRGRIAPAYLFCGPRGTGKTSSARILARSLNCLAGEAPTAEPCGRCELCTAIAAGTALDVIEIDAASHTGVDNIRELIERSRFAPVQARWKVYVVDECHMLSTAAFNALLKTLEEPPPRVVFVLATTDPQRVLATILSRCQRFDFRRIPLEPLQAHLRFIAEAEGIGITPEALHVVAQRAQGGLRDAESLLDQLSLLPPPIEAGAVWDLLGAVPEEELLALAEAMAAAEPLAVVEACRLLLERGREPGAVLQGLASFLRDLLLAGVAPDRLELTSVSHALRPRLPETARRIGKVKLLQWQAQLRGGEQQLRHSVQPRLWLEVLLLGLLAEPLAAAPGAAAAPTRNGARPEAPREPHPAPVPAEVSTPVSTPVSAPVPVAAVPPALAEQDPLQEASAAAAASAAATPNLSELWQNTLARLELPSTRMLLSQQAQLVRLDSQRAVVRVAGTWMAMVQSRLPLLEKALAGALGSGRQLVLEPGGEPKAAPAVVPARAPLAAPPAAESPAAMPPAPPSSSAQPEPDAALPHLPVRTEQRPTTPELDPPEPARSEPLAAPATAVQSGSAGAALAMPSPLEEKAKRLAEFFNGEVIADVTDQVA